MKTIGRSEEDEGYIVVMSHQEYSAMAKLVRAIEGKPLETWTGEIPMMLHSSPDLSNALIAVRAFATTLSIAEDLSRMVNNVKEYLLKVDEAG